ncbi:uncharacterized protein [Phyllobates terribilis]|uniref:uncharacterized protein isoform X2 n=1 Tax=Phyllobates terribilis TaxID=111132 RepID=UPI003CCB3584
MEAPAGPGTVGELLLALYEMGFDESQVRAALRAGCFQVQDAADWILQGGLPRGTLLTQGVIEPGAMAVSAFNPPLQLGREVSEESSSSGSPSSPELHPLPSSRHPEQRREYEERQSASLAREVMEEKRTKKKDRDLVLQRIAEDRRMQHDKKKITTTSERLESREHPAVRNTTHDHCTLTVRLPSGQCVRLSLAGDSKLQAVYDHVCSLLPTPGKLLQTFPSRRFTDEDLPLSLQELGLTPSATLCVHPGAHTSPELLNTSLEPPMCDAAQLMMQGDKLLPILRSPAQAVTPNIHMVAEPAPQHSWGRGHRLAHQEENGAEEEEAAGVHAASPDHRVSAGSHQWPESGVRLRSAPQPDGDSSPHPPHVMARAAAEMRQESAERPEPPRIRRTSAAPTLRSLTLRRAMPIITDPHLQYPGSLSGLTPDLVEMIIDHMIKERILFAKTLELFSGCAVRVISLSCYPYCTNDLVRQLRVFPGLRRLSLSSSSLITDHGLSELKHLQKIQNLNLSGCCNLTESCLLHLRGLKHLSHLVLDQTKVRDGGMCDFLLNTSCSLTHLSVNQTAISERTLSMLVERCPDLRLLSMKHTLVTDISSLSGLKQLTALHLDRTHVTEQSLQTVSSFPALSTLTLSGVQSLNSSRVLELLPGMTLSRLLLPGRDSLSDAGLSHLSCHIGLLELDLTDHTQITDQGVQHIAQLTRMRVLSLCNTSVSDAGLLHLRGLKLLEQLSLDRTKVTSRGVSECIPHLLHLQVLSLSQTGVGDNVLKLGVQKCKNLLKLNLSRTRVTNKGLRFLRNAAIVQLCLDGSGVTPEGVSGVISICPNLTSLRAHHLRLIPADQVSEEEEGS